MNDVYIERAASVRAVEFIVRYKFNTVKAKYKGKGAGKRKWIDCKCLKVSHTKNGTFSYNLPA